MLGGSVTARDWRNKTIVKRVTGKLMSLVRVFDDDMGDV